MFPHSQTDLDFFLLQWKQMLLFVPVPAAVVVVVVVVAAAAAAAAAVTAAVGVASFYKTVGTCLRNVLSACT
jgi:hypothetical protein